MSNNWQNLRPWNGSQNTAFEELCCQIARYEQVPSGSVFIRKGAPDAGVECFWKLPNGDEWGWQAKFFLSPPGVNQWRQVNDSIITALEKHPRLTSFTICFPIDRQDPRIERQKWFMDKWNEYVEKWQGLAKEKGMSVEFYYWGEHEIWERLSREEHRGRRFFWFQEELLSQVWFKDRLDETISNAGPRYSPELNIELSIAHIFESLGRTSKFYNQIKVLYGEIKRAYLKTNSKKVKEVTKDKFDSLGDTISSFLSILENVETSDIKPINFDSITELASKSKGIAWECAHDLENAAKEEKKSASFKEQQGQKSSRPDDFGYKRHYLYELIRRLNEVEDFVKSYKATLANTPSLLLIGEAGTGKTHLFCDIGKHRINAGLPTIILLGGQFNNEEPWLQIIRLLGLSCTREEFLGALEAAAQAYGSRTLILIDALNEGEGKKLWNKYLAGMLMTLSKYSWIGIAVSVRTSYATLIIPDGLDTERLITEVHHGFADYEYQATRTFFDHYGIERPSVPLLVPEFQNPLFLKLFCQGLNNLKLTKVPPGMQGITLIFNFFIESINEKLSRPEYLDFDSKLKVVQKAVEKLSEAMATKGNNWLPREETQDIVNAFLLNNGYEKSLFRHMISEGLLAENRFLVRENEWCEGIHFSYERFTDHLIARYLLDKYLDLENPSDSFQPTQFLGTFVKDEWSCWQNRGLVEAFSIQIPERIKKELVEIVPECTNFRPVSEAFIESLIWRDPGAITETTKEYINKHIIQYKDTHEQFLNALLTVATNPNHPYNGDFLHKNLMSFELAERDTWWSIFIHHQYGIHGAVDRLVDWAWSAEDKSHIADDSIRLCGIALAWFLTTSNRFLRDRTTKALVSLLTNRISVLKLIIQEFLQVNDPYVLERLFAVAYGCAMRSTNNDAIAELAKSAYEWIFKEGMPPTHILLRDYARGVIEVSLNRGTKLNIDPKKIRPPYKSEWPSFDIPTIEELKKYGEWQQDMPDEEWARVHLYDSVMEHGDFARYIIGTNSGHFEWSSCFLNEPRGQSRKEKYEAFLQSLTDRQKKAWEKYYTTRKNVDRYRMLDEYRRNELFKHQFTDEELEIALSSSGLSFRKTLDDNKLKVFERCVIPYLDDPYSYRDEYRFDLSIAQRWIFKRVLDMGWTVERFGMFDRNLDRYSNQGRDAYKTERIGKKYQWIAYHEFLAFVSDNFEFRGESRSDQPEKYEGTWQITGVRNIDPSCLLRETKGEEWKPHINTWWFPSSYNAWDVEPDTIAWLKKDRDLPAIEQLIELTNPENSSKWLTLEAFYRWEQPTPPEKERFEISRHEIWYILNSYIVKKSYMNELFEWAKQQNFMGQWMPESREFYRIFLGEFFWSPSFEYYNSFNCQDDGWTRGRRDNLIPKEILVSTERYLQEYSGYDCSIDETLRIYLPAKWLVERMGLRWNGAEGHFFDDRGNLIAFDPSIRSPGPGALLINRGVFLKFLSDNDYDILWTIHGEKNIIGGMISHDNWKGRLELNGAYRIHENKVNGAINSRFISRG